MAIGLFSSICRLHGKLNERGQRTGYLEGLDVIAYIEMRLRDCGL